MSVKNTGSFAKLLWPGVKAQMEKEYNRANLNFTNLTFDPVPLSRPSRVQRVKNAYIELVWRVKTAYAILVRGESSQRGDD